MFKLAKAGKFRASRPAILALAVCGGLPVCGWLAWCKYAFGNFTGSAAKIALLDWTLKPFAEWWHHPIFTPHGLWIFNLGVLATFWQGEFLWNRLPLASPVADLIYTISSVAFIAIAVAALLFRRAALDEAQRRALWFSFACVAASVAFLGFLSIIYDFGDCFHPSRALPYFTSGRLLLGALIPFLLLFVYGLDRALQKFGNAVKFSALAVMILFMLVSEIAIDWPAFFSLYNWFHM
jgi:hypothetical protein